MDNDGNNSHVDTFVVVNWPLSIVNFFGGFFCLLNLRKLRKFRLHRLIVRFQFVDSSVRLLRFVGVSQLQIAFGKQMKQGCIA